MHIDDQLIKIEDSLDDISDEFLHLDEQLAAHIEDEEAAESAEAAAAVAEVLDGVDLEANPFDDWLVDSERELHELLEREDGIQVGKGI